MTAISLYNTLAQTEGFAEVHHLFWIKPFVNRDRQDLGWSCRDDALILDLVAVMLGMNVTLVTSKAFFGEGPSNDGIRQC